MALINTFPPSVNNKLTSAGLTVRYESEVAATPASGRIYKVTRHAAKNYSYIGMSLSAARSCEAAMLAKYYRQFADWKYEDGKIVQSFVFKTGADITIAQTSGDNHTVDISVSEDDVIYTAEDATTVEGCRRAFAFAEVRDYDEDSPAFTGLAIVLANYDDANQLIRISYATNIANFNTANLQIQWYNDATGSWSTISSVFYEHSTGTITSYSIRRSKFRLRYDVTPEILSQEVTPVEDPQSYLLFLKSATDDVQSCRTTFEYQYTGTSAQWWNYIKVDRYDDDRGTWNEIPASQVKTVGAVLFAIEMDDGEHHSYRLRWQNGEDVVYSNSLVSSGDALSDYTLAITAAKNRLDENGDLVTDVYLSTNLDINWLRRSNFKYRFTDGITTELLNSSKVTATSGGFIATVFDAATMEAGQKVQALYGEITGEEYLLKSNETILTNEDSAVVTTLTVTTSAASTSIHFQNVSVYSSDPMTWDWGDGNVETNLTAAPAAHTYAAAGTYTIRISGGAYELGSGFIDNTGTALTAASISAKIRGIGGNAFVNSGLTKIALPRVPEIYGSAFYNANGTGALTTVNLPGTTAIGPSAFGGNPLLSSLTIGQNMATVFAMEDYPWGLPTGAKIHCTDGDLTVE